MIFELYQDRNRLWRWRLRAGNNKIIANGGEGYSRRRGCMRMISKIGATFKYKVIEV